MCGTRPVNVLDVARSMSKWFASKKRHRLMEK